MRLEQKQNNLGYEYKITMKLIENIINIDDNKDDEIYQS